jgi:hypothetical protein
MKLKTWLLIGLVTGFLGLRSPLLLVALVNVAIRFEANNPFLWTPFGFHYGLAVMPIVFVAFLDAYPRWRENRFGLVRQYARWSGPVILGIALILAPHFPATLYVGHLGSHIRLSARVKTAYEMMSHIPDGALVEASNDVAPHLTDRCDVVMWPFTQIDTQWLLVDTEDRYYVVRGEQAHVADVQRRGYQIVEQRDSFILLRAPGT